MILKMEYQKAFAISFNQINSLDNFRDAAYTHPSHF